MATGAPLTLMDLARRTDPDGSAADVAELLSQCNEMYDDLVMKEGNTNTGHVFTVRTALPQGSWRYINQGVQTTKSQTAQGRINCGMLEDQLTLDRKLMNMQEDPTKFRYEEDNAHLEGLSQQIAGQFIYGNQLTLPAAFTGIAPYYNTLSTATAANAVNVFNGGGSSSNNSSLWMFGWSPRTVYGVFPKGSKAGLTLEPMDTTQLAYDSSGNPYRAAVTWFSQEAGLCLEDWRWVTRLCNLDVTSAGLGGTSPFDIFATMSQMILRFPKMPMGVSGVTMTDAKSEMGMEVRGAIYANRTVRGFMDIQAIRDKNVLIGMNDYAGKPVTTYRGLPIRVVDQIKSSETTIS